MKKHNFCAGPSILAEEVVKKSAAAVLNFNGTGLSLLELSHRSTEFQEVMDSAQAKMKEVLDIPAGYKVLYLGGGASTQFLTIPFNLLAKKAAYLETGTWAKKAIKEAKFFGEVDVVASSADTVYSYIPKGYTIPADADYFHITTNNTIYGTEIFDIPQTDVPIIADASSNILSRPLDISKFGIVYGGAQKNLGPAGVTFVIVKEDLLGKVDRAIPTILDYRTHIDNDSMFNTPPCFQVYSCLQSLIWIQEQGGLEAMEKKNKDKANLLYDEIDSNPLFKGTAALEDRSRMNVTFVMEDEYKDLEKEFMAYATERGIIQIKGHRSIGGFRASIYNAMPKESVQVLVSTMKSFANNI